ncbi:hypothetical protein GCM10027026_46050 [Myroides odoratimimus subsp. xuanwuensis]
MRTSQLRPTPHVTIPAGSDHSARFDRSIKTRRVPTERRPMRESTRGLIFGLLFSAPFWAAVGAAGFVLAR